MSMILPADTYAEMLAAADAAGSTRIQARASWVIANKTTLSPPETAIQPGYRVAMLRCDPPPCVELWVVAEDAIASDWQVG